VSDRRLAPRGHGQCFATAASRQPATARRASTHAISRSTAGACSRPAIPASLSPGWGLRAARWARQKGGGCDGGCESKFSLISIQTKDTEKIWDTNWESEMSAFSSRLVSASSTTKSRLFIMEMRRSADYSSALFSLCERKFSPLKNASFISRAHAV
jgi:hypothetical protein